MEKMLLKSTTRHVRIFTAEVVDNELKFHPNKLTLDLDPDNEFIWNENSLEGCIDHCELKPLPKNLDS